ncbi:MAG: hypothetical protein ACRDWG_17600 [Actinomycetes bacterium]
MNSPIARVSRWHRLAGLRAALYRTRPQWSGLAASRDRGDVPGWVLIAVMTAGLVTVLWAVAGPRLTSMLEQALDSVVGP